MRFCRLCHAGRCRICRKTIKQENPPWKKIACTPTFKRCVAAAIFLEVELAKQKGDKPDLEAKRAQRKRKLEKGEEDKAAKRRKVDKKKKKVPSKPKSKALKVAGFQKKSSKLVRRLLKKFGPVDFVLFPSPESTDQKLVGTLVFENNNYCL